MTDDQKDPRSFNHPARPMLDETDISEVANALLTLTKEVWVLRDRLTILEAVLKEKNIDVSEAIDNFQPDQALQQQLSKESSELIAKILDALNSGSS